MKSIEKIGRFPVEGNVIRESGEFIRITPDATLDVISGTKNPVLLHFYVSNDVVHVGELVIPAGGIGPRQTEYDRHEGDVLFYVTKGEITFIVPQDEETFVVPENESMFIPKGCVYKAINYSSEVVKAMFIIAPSL